MNNELFQKRLKKLVSRKFDELTGVTTDQDIVQSIIREVGDADTQGLLEMAISGEVEKQRRLRSIERYDASQSNLFGEGILDKLINVDMDGEKAVIPYRYATWQYLNANRENQLLNLRKAHQAFERAEQRRAKLLPFMSNDLMMTVEDALLKMGVMEVQN